MAFDMSAKKPSKQCLQEILESGLFSDITVKSGTAEARAHKSILASKSPWFKKKFEGRLKDANTVTLHLDLEKCNNYLNDEELALLNKAILEAFLSFCYIDDYSNTTINGKTSGFLYCALYNLASAYELDSLKWYSKQALSKTISALIKAKDPDTAFHRIKLNFELNSRNADFEEVILAAGLQEFERRIKQLEDTGHFEETLKRMKDNPLATIELYKQRHLAQTKDTHAMTGVSGAKHEWACAACGTSFFYEKKPHRKEMRLPACPCCIESLKSLTVTAANEDEPASKKRKRNSK